MVFDWANMNQDLSSSTSIIIMTAVAGLALVYYVFRKRNDSNKNTISQIDLDKLLEQRKNMANNSSYRTSISSSDFISKMKRTGKNIVFFYGSQTGTAEEFATRLAKSAPKYGMKGFAYDTEEVTDWDLLNNVSEVERGFAVFCMATYGEGDPTDNAIEFHNYLKDADIDLSGLKFSVFGLGNRTYEHYNSMGKFVDQQLAKLGGERLCELGLGDDDQNIEEDFVQWQENVFWPAVCNVFSIESTGEFSSVRQFQLQTYESAPDRVFRGEPSRFQSYEKQKPPFEAKNPFLATLTTERKLNSGSDRYFMHIELNIEDSKMRYESGDHVAVLPVNQKSIVEKLGKLLKIEDLDAVISLNNVDSDDAKQHPFPCPTTYRVAFSHYLDITSHPTTHLCRELAEYAHNEEDKNFLLLISSNTDEGKEQFKKWIKSENRTIVEILEDLTSLEVPADHLCELLPRLQVRYYSISSSPKFFPTSVHVTAVLVSYTTSVGREVKGVCTQYLLDKANETEQESSYKKLACYIRKSQFRLPMKTSVPIIMIGPGTGFAPFRGFLQEKEWQKDQKKPVGDVVLYYGCRKSANDFIYKEEIDHWVEKGVITSLYTAFSRDQDSKVYVQDRLAENGESTWELLSKGAHIYICGDAKNMARDVYACLERIISKHGEMTMEQATQYLKNMSNKGRYSADVWS